MLAALLFNVAGDARRERHELGKGEVNDILKALMPAQFTDALVKPLLHVAFPVFPSAAMGRLLTDVIDRPWAILCPRPETKGTGYVVGYREFLRDALGR